MSSANRGKEGKKDSHHIPLDLRLGIRIALIIVGISLCLTSLSLYAGFDRFSKIQIEANKKMGHDLSCFAAALSDKDEIEELISQVRRIYESAPPGLRDEAANPGEDVLYSVEDGEYEALYDSVRTDSFYKVQKKLEQAVKDIGAIAINVVFIDEDRSRMVYVVSAVGGDEYEQVYSAPGYWSETFDFVLDYISEDRPDPEGVHMSYDLFSTNERVISSMVPLYVEGRTEPVGYITLDRPWSGILSERSLFLRHFLLVVGIVTLILTALSELILHFAVMRPLNRLTREQTRMATELDVASDIQLSLLPEKDWSISSDMPCSIHAALYPAREVGGDLYDFFTIDDDHIALVIADVVGKGVPASLFSMVTKTMLKMSLKEGNSPGEAFSKVNDQMCENNPESLFATAWLGIYTISEGSLVYSNAGHTDPVLYHMEDAGEERWSMVRGDHNIALGLIPSSGEPYQENTMTVSKGDRLLLYTDGVTEAQIPYEMLYGEGRFLAFLNANPDLKGRELLDAAFADVVAFSKNYPQFDDITMLLLEVG